MPTTTRKRSASPAARDGVKRARLLEARRVATTLFQTLHAEDREASLVTLGALLEQRLVLPPVLSETLGSGAALAPLGEQLRALREPGYSNALYVAVDPFVVAEHPSEVALATLLRATSGLRVDARTCDRDASLGRQVHAVRAGLRRGEDGACEYLLLLCVLLQFSLDTGGEPGKLGVDPREVFDLYGDGYEFGCTLEAALRAMAPAQTWHTYRTLKRAILDMGDAGPEWAESVHGALDVVFDALAGHAEALGDTAVAKLHPWQLQLVYVAAQRRAAREPVTQPF